MTRPEVAAVLHRLAAAYRAEITKAEAEVWADHLEDRDVEVAFAATDNLIAQADGFFPTIAKFREACRAEQRRRDARRPALAEAPLELIEPSKLQDLLSETRSKLGRTP